MRRVKDPAKESPPDHISSLLWQLPVSSTPNPVSLLTLKAPSNYPNGYRMKHFDCNQPDTTGYSVATDGTAVYDIIAHKRGEKPTASMYEDAAHCLMQWMHMPIDKDEYLMQISRQAERSGLRRPKVVGLVVRLRDPFPWAYAK